MVLKLGRRDTKKLLAIPNKDLKCPLFDISRLNTINDDHVINLFTDVQNIA